jgi:hypothetical protein
MKTYPAAIEAVGTVGNPRMSNPNGIRKFQYRPCRVTAEFDVEFVTGEKTFHGSCKDVSDAGLRAEFDGSVAIGSTGLLILRHQMGVLRLESQVAYIEKSQVGLVFLLKTAWEVEVLAAFIASISNPTADWLLTYRQRT